MGWRLSATLGRTVLKIVRPRELGDIVGFVVFLSRGGNVASLAEVWWRLSSR